MSEPIPPSGGGGGFLSAKIFGIPAIVVLGGIAILAYIYFRKQSGGTSTGGGGTATTGNISISPSSENISVNYKGPTSQYNGPSTVINKPVPRHGTPNPQPTPHPKPKKKKVSQQVHHNPQPKPFVTVAKWPGKSTGGLAQWNTTLWGISQHTHTPLSELLKLNPQIKNANLIYPGEKVYY